MVFYEPMDWKTEFCSLTALKVSLKNRGSSCSTE